MRVGLCFCFLVSVCGRGCETRGVSQGEKKFMVVYPSEVWAPVCPIPPNDSLFLWWTGRCSEGVAIINTVERPLNPKFFTFFFLLFFPKWTNEHVLSGWVIVYMMSTECWHKRLELINIHSSSHCIFKWMLCLFRSEINECVPNWFCCTVNNEAILHIVLPQDVCVKMLLA